jgi:hypothetical protein
VSDPAKVEADLQVILEAMDGDISTMTLLTLDRVLEYGARGAVGDKRAQQIFRGVAEAIQETMHAKGDARKLCACCGGVIDGIPGYPVLVEVPENKVGILLLPTHLQCSVQRDGKKVPGKEVLRKALVMFREHLHDGVREVPAASVVKQGGNA